MATELSEIQPLSKPTPPEAAVRDFKNIVVSFHFPKEVLSKPECIPSPAEWFVELRQYFVDLPQQLGQLEQFSKATAGSSTGAGTAGHENEDVRSLARWKDYQVPDGRAGESVVQQKRTSHRFRYPNLKFTRRIVFSQRENDGQWLTGRWMAVAYVSASTREALQQLDWCQLISPETMADLHAYNVGPKKLQESWAIDLRRFYQLERKRPEYVYQYDGGETTSKQQQPQSHCAEEEKKNMEKQNKAIIQATTRAKKSDGEQPPGDDEGIATTLEECTHMMVPTVWQMVSTRCQTPWGKSSPNLDIPVIPHGMPIPTELEDRGHIRDGYGYGCKFTGPVPYHAENRAVPPGMPISQVLEDRCHLVDRTWQALMRGGAVDVTTTTTTEDEKYWDKEWDLID